MAIRAYVNGRTLKAMSADYSDALIRGEAVTLLPAIPNVSWVVVDGEPSMADDEADVNDSPTAITKANWNRPGVVETQTPDYPVSRAVEAAGLPRFDTSIFADTFEAYRQQGRDEVLREIAKITKFTDDICCFCGNYDYNTHEPNCLWLRASQVVNP